MAGKDGNMDGIWPFCYARLGPGKRGLDGGMCVLGHVVLGLNRSGNNLARSEITGGYPQDGVRFAGRLRLQNKSAR